MKTYWFYGASDDLVEVEGEERIEYNLPYRNEHGVFKLSPGDDVNGGVHIHVRYEQTGCWSLGMSPLDEDVPVPAGWRFTLTQATAKGTAPTYSAVLEATVDDDAVLTWETPA